MFDAMRPFELSEVNHFEGDRRTLSKNYKKSPPFSWKDSMSSEEWVLALSNEFHNVERMNTEKVAQPGPNRESDLSRMINFDSFQDDQEVVLLDRSRSNNSVEQILSTPERSFEDNRQIVVTVEDTEQSDGDDTVVDLPPTLTQDYPIQPAPL
jgi:hypothetical protein